MKIHPIYKYIGLTPNIKRFFFYNTIIRLSLSKIVFFIPNYIFINPIAALYLKLFKYQLNCNEKNTGRDSNPRPLG